jgi:hypothetical protein
MSRYNYDDQEVYTQDVPLRQRRAGGKSTRKAQELVWRVRTHETRN